MKEISTYLQDHFPDFLDDLRALVGIDCGTAALRKAGVDAVGRLFRDQLQAAGCELTECEGGVRIASPFWGQEQASINFELKSLTPATTPTWRWAG